MTDNQRQKANIEVSLTRLDWEIGKLSNRLARVSGCKPNRAVDHLERIHARAQSHRLLLVGMLRDVGGLR